MNQDKLEEYGSLIVIAVLGFIVLVGGVWAYKHTKDEGYAKAYAKEWSATTYVEEEYEWSTYECTTSCSGYGEDESCSQDCEWVDHTSWSTVCSLTNTGIALEDFAYPPLCHTVGYDMRSGHYANYNVWFYKEDRPDRETFRVGLSREMYGLVHTDSTICAFRQNAFNMYFISECVQ